MRWTNCPIPIEAVSPSPETPSGRSVRFARAAPVAIDTWHPYVVVYDTGAVTATTVGNCLHVLAGAEPRGGGAIAFGAAAAICSTASFAPQAWKIIRSRDTSSISGKMYALTVAAFLLWLCYGWLRSDWALILPNAICLVLASFILAMKQLPQRKKEAVADTLDPKR